jgi:hypothetical protein
MLSRSTAPRVFFSHSALARFIAIRTEVVLLGLSLSLLGCATKITARHSVSTTPDKSIYDARPVEVEDGIGLALDIFTPGLYADTGDVLDKALKVLNDDIDYREKRYFRGIHNSKTFYFSQEASKPSTPDSLNPAKDPGISAGRKIDQ